MSHDFEEDALRRTARDLLSGGSDSRTPAGQADQTSGFPEAVYGSMAELGFFGLLVPEEYGGVEGRFVDMFLVLEEIGRSSMPGPFFSTAVTSALTLLNLGSEAQKRAYLRPLAGGEQYSTLAVNEETAWHRLDALTTSATRRGGAWVIRGRKLFVPDADVADYVLVVARIENTDGVAVFLVDNASSGVHTRQLHTMGPDRQFEVILEEVEVPELCLLNGSGKPEESLDTVLLKSAIAACAQALGGAQRVLEITLAYAKERRQFGRPIGSFQAVQMHCAEMAADVHAIKCIATKAARAFDVEGGDAGVVARAAKTFVGEAYLRVVKRAHRVHGAIGFSAEYGLGPYTRAAEAARSAFGDAEFHRQALAEEHL